MQYALAPGFKRRCSIFTTEYYLPSGSMGDTLLLIGSFFNQAFFKCKFFEEGRVHVFLKYGACIMNFLSEWNIFFPAECHYCERLQISP